MSTMKRLTLAAALAATLAVALAGCAQSCSGHGSCGAGEMCTCEAGYIGLDCSKRECPYGLSWFSASDDDAVVPGGRGLGGTHPYTECSSAGICDYSAGTCACFEGYTGRGCRTKACPNDCSGHGKCYSNFEVEKNYTSIGGASFNTLFRDFLSSRQCVCDRGFKGADCSLRMCPRGDDPVTDCGTAADMANAAAHEMIQRIYVRTLGPNDATLDAGDSGADANAGAFTDTSTCDTQSDCPVTAESCKGYFECDWRNSSHTHCTEKTRWYANEALCQKQGSMGMTDLAFETEYSAIDCYATALDALCGACDGPATYGTPCIASDGRGVCDGRGTGTSKCIKSWPTYDRNMCMGAFSQGASEKDTRTVFGYIALKYTDMFGGVYKTRPILISNQCEEAQFINEYDPETPTIDCSSSALGETCEPGDCSDGNTYCYTADGGRGKCDGSDKCVEDSNAIGTYDGAHTFNNPQVLAYRAMQYGGLGAPKTVSASETLSTADSLTDDATSTSYPHTFEESSSGSILKLVHAGTAASTSTATYDQVRSTRYAYTADRIRAALQDLPNFAIPTVNVTNYYIDRHGEKAMFTNVFDVTFTSAFTAGKQPLMECIYEQSNACEGAFPRLANSGSLDSLDGPTADPICSPEHGERGTAGTATADNVSPCNEKYFPAWGSANVYSCTVEEVHPGTKNYEENAECSNRGMCDTSTGTCTCHEGHTGEACQTQTVFF